MLSPSEAAGPTATSSRCCPPPVSHLSCCFCAKKRQVPPQTQGINFQNKCSRKEATARGKDAGLPLGVGVTRAPPGRRGDPRPSAAEPPHDSAGAAAPLPPQEACRAAPAASGAWLRGSSGTLAEPPSHQNSCGGRRHCADLRWGQAMKNSHPRHAGCGGQALPRRGATRAGILRAESQLSAPACRRPGRILFLKANILSGCCCESGCTLSILHVVCHLTPPPNNSHS